MGLSEEGDESETFDRFQSLCAELNSDIKAQEDAWKSYLLTKDNYTLEGDGLHWLACALYVSCRRSNVPSVRGGADVEGNCVSLTRILRSTKLSLIEFFKKMKKWADMASLPPEFRNKVDHLERNFAVSKVTFEKFNPIYLDIFQPPINDPTKIVKSRKQKRTPCTSSELFKFCWTLFVHVKGNFPAISDDLVNSYHLLLCCVDLVYSNVLLCDRSDLMNPLFTGLPKNYTLRDYKPPQEPPCIITYLCEKYDALTIEAKQIKEHWFKPYLRKLFDKKELLGKAENLTGIVDVANFERNSKTINKMYDEYVLCVGDFDERIFLGEESHVEIGSPVKSSSVSRISLTGEIAEKSESSRSVVTLNDLYEARTIAPGTPLTGRSNLKGDKDNMITPVSTATQSVGKLQLLLSGRKIGPSAELVKMFSECQRNPQDEIQKRVKEMGKIFVDNFSKSNNEMSGYDQNFANQRLQLGECLYYKELENILNSELRRRTPDNKTLDLSNLLEQEIFHQSLLAICLEIVIFSYNSQRIFPWILEVYDLSSYYFYRVIEILIRSEDGLSRDVVKHLNHIEEMILERLAWKNDSPLWEILKQSADCIPSVEDVTLPSQLEKDGQNGLFTASVASADQSPARSNTASKTISQSRDMIIQSPLSIPNVSDRFGSPVVAKRRLAFNEPTLVQTPGTSATTVLPTTSGNPTLTPSISMLPMAIIADKAGKKVLIPVQFRPAVSALKKDEPVIVTQPEKPELPPVVNKPKKTGSLALFFRKVYHLASVRLRHMCERLQIEAELCSQIWTCLEHCFVHHIELMKDRHIDQLMMCCCYVISKVTKKDKTFQDIMWAYRLQPQSESHVYRSVLISSHEKTVEAGSDNEAGVKSEAKNSSARKTRSERKAIEGENSAHATQPPTPTRLAGVASSFQLEDHGEERGDLIKFYNMVFVVQIRTFALKFSPALVQNGTDKPILSPLPVVRSHGHSPRKISAHHSVYVSPRKLPVSARVTSNGDSVTPQTRLLYCFNRSPARDLHAINVMLRPGEQLNGSRNISLTASVTGKRLALSDEGAADSPAKRIVSIQGGPCISSGQTIVGLHATPGMVAPLGTGKGLNSRLKELISDRQASSNGFK